MITKANVLESLKDIPEEFSLDELIDKLIFIQKVEEGLAQSNRGEVHTEEEAKAMLKKWSE